jgi:predicted ArsR family transcriptional regulator
MSRGYVKVEEQAERIYELLKEGKTQRQVGEALGLTRDQIKEFLKRQRRKRRKIEAGYIPLPKGRPRKNWQDKQANEIALLRMQVELLKNFLSEAGRR